MIVVLVAVFKSKTEVFKFLEELRSLGVPAQTTGTPKEARIGCGLAVKFPNSAIEKAKRLLYYGSYSSFFGVFSISTSNGKSQAYKIL